MNKIIKKNKQLYNISSRPIYPRFIKSELPIYIDLCKDKIENYTYNQWKNDIVDSLNENVFHYNICDESEYIERIDNFYHYIRNKKRTLENVNRISLPIMICYTSIFFSCIIGMLPNGTVLNIIKIAIVLPTLVFCLKELINNQKKNDFEYCFYCDLIEIVDEMKKIKVQTKSKKESQQCDNLKG